MATLFYDSFWLDLLGGGFDLDTDDIKAALVTSTYSMARTTHNRFDDITNEVVAAGYTAGGELLTGLTLTLDTSGHGCSLDFVDPVWTANITARGLVLYKDSGTPSTSPLIAFYDFGTDQVSSGGGIFTAQVHASGAFKISAAV